MIIWFKHQINIETSNKIPIEKERKNIREEDIVNYLLKKQYLTTKMVINGNDTSVLYKKKVIVNYSNDPVLKKKSFLSSGGRNISGLVIFFISEMENVDMNSIKNFSKECFSRSDEISKKKGNGFIAIPLLIAKQVDNKAIEWVREQSRYHLISLEYPVIFEISSGNYYYFKNIEIWKRKIYFFAQNETVQLFNEI
ncbi:MAG: hypothetical protein MUF15_04445 [Acidobacteria bacterium]|nr:hypothetical protein [Acidobacteriota bacterium]